MSYQKIRSSKTGRYLQQYHIDYIKEHGEKLTYNQLAEATGFSVAALHGWCKQFHIKPTKAVFQHQKPIIPLCIPPSKTN